MFFADSPEGETWSFDELSESALRKIKADCARFCADQTTLNYKDAIICGRLEKVGKVTSFSFLAKHVLHSTRRERAP